MDDAPHVSGLCPRRAGKSYAGAAAALITGEAKPGSISLIISLNLKQLKRLYWAGGPSGLFTLNDKFGLGLSFNKNETRWEHENGSIGYLLGTDTQDQIESIRGMEADLYLIDECQAQSPRTLNNLIDDIIDPQRSTRQGRVILIGTPGNILEGPFYEATCEEKVDDDKRPYCVAPGTTDKWGRTAKSDLLWSFHHWSLQENTAAPHQWRDALIKKRNRKWSDDDIQWRREYLGRWVNGSEGTVYRYYDEKRVQPAGWVNWTPDTSSGNPTGLPHDGDWHLLGGLDLGFNDPTAFVVAAYSQKMGELRHVWDFSSQHMLPDDVADLLREAQRKFGKFEAIYADTGNLGKMVVQSLVNQGFPVEAANKREKYDHIELLNSAFHRGEIKIIEDTTLERQLITNCWALGDKSIAELARRGRLIEDVNVPNDSCDAFLYLFRGAMHRYRAEIDAPAEEYMSPTWIKAWEKEQLRLARSERQMSPFDKALRGGITHPSFLRDAIHGRD